MDRTLRALVVVLFSSLIAVLALAGCGKKSVTGPAGGDTDTLLQEANAELEATLQALSTSSPQRPADIDVSAPLAKYEQVLVRQPSNTTANFGAAVLGVVALTTDPQVNQAFDEWKAYLQGHVPFEAGGSGLRPLGIPATPTPGMAALNLPFPIVPLTPLAMLHATAPATDPQIATVQNILRDRALPRLVTAIARLGAAARPEFRFVVTPTMMGDPGATPMEIDRSDVLALKAAMELLAGACHAAVAYDLGFPSYDSTGIVTAMRPGGSWLRLRADGAAQMAGAQASLLASCDDVEASIASLRAETDDQDDDWIKDRRSSSDSILVRVAQVREGLTSGYGLRGDWDGDGSVTALTVRFDRLFTEPVTDWKGVLPAYTVSTLRRPLGQTTAFEEGLATRSVTVPQTRSYYGYYDHWISGSYPPYEYFDGDSTLLAPMRAAVAQEYARVAALPGYGGEYHGYCTFYGVLVAGTQSVQLSWWHYYRVANVIVHVPVITWTADSWSQWTWNPTALNGLFPGITTSSQLLATFGSTSSDWQKTVVLDWTQGVTPLLP